MSHSSPPPRIRMSGRSFLALTLTPEPPLTDWIAALDYHLTRSASFFTNKSVILDLSLLQANTPHLAELLPALQARHIHILGIENGNRHWPAVAEWDWVDAPPTSRTTAPIIPTPDETPPSPPPPPSTLFVEETVRSGQSIIHPEGDVVIFGSVSSGAEVSAGGSVHIYGALRGRVIAGIGGNAKARILTHLFDAELIAIDGFYTITEEIDPLYLGKPTQVLLVGEILTFRLIKI